jgi:hypothetical protein
MRKRVIGDLNPKEKRVLANFPVTGEPITLAELGKLAYSHLRPRAKGIWTVRNCMRKLVKLGLTKKVARGTYMRPVAQ